VVYYAPLHLISLKSIPWTPENQSALTGLQPHKNQPDELRDIEMYVMGSFIALEAVKDKIFV